MRRPRLPFARRRAEGSPEDSPPGSPSPAKDDAATQLSKGAQPAQPAGTQTPAAPQDPIDGLRAWIAQVERKLGVRTYVGAAVAVLGLAAAGVALVLTLTLKQDAATDSDISSLREQVTAVEQSASEAAQEDVQGLDRRLAELEDEVERIATGQTTARRELKVVQDDIDELRNEVSGAGNSSGGTGGASESGSDGSQAPPP
jgi:uncharacterized protein HemX